MPHRDPLPADIQRAMDALTAAIGQGEFIPPEAVRNCMTSPSAELRGIAFYLLFERQELIEQRIEQSSRGEHFQFCLRFLLDCAAVDRGGDYVPSRCEVLEYFRAWIQMLLRSRDNFRDAIAAIRDALAEVYLPETNEGRDMVVLIVLEHVFESEAARTIFAAWLTNPTLALAYEEGIKLSEIWRSHGGHG